MSKGILHFTSESEAIDFIERANDLGIEWVPGEIKDMGSCYGLIIEELHAHSRKNLYDLYYSY